MKNFEAGKTYTFKNKKFKCLNVFETGEKVATFAPVKGCICYKKEAFDRVVIVNQTTKIQQVKMTRGNYSKIWMRASSEI